MKCPCQGCEPPKRTITCHITGNCKEHDEWKEYIQQRNENREKAKTCKDLPPVQLHKWWKNMKNGVKKK